MIYFQLFLTFLKVGSFTFGGGYAMLSLISESVLSYGWMTEEELLNFLGVETVIPGPISVNMATYVGYEQGGFMGALLATLGVSLSSFIIILLVVSCIKNLLKYEPVKAFLEGMRSSAGGLITSVAITMALTTFLGIDSIKTKKIIFNWYSFIILFTIILIPILWKKYKKKEFSSILLVIISGLLGIVFF